MLKLTKSWQMMADGKSGSNRLMAPVANLFHSFVILAKPGVFLFLFVSCLLIVCLLFACCSCAAFVFVLFFVLFCLIWMFRFCRCCCFWFVCLLMLLLLFLLLLLTSSMFFTCSTLGIQQCERRKEPVFLSPVSQP